jgi:hypothetical protein
MATTLSQLALFRHCFVLAVDLSPWIAQGVMKWVVRLVSFSFDKFVFSSERRFGACNFLQNGRNFI